MRHKKSLALACLAMSTLPLLAGCSQGEGGAAFAQSPPPAELLNLLNEINRKLDGVTQSWDKNLPSASRFTVLPAFNNQAVLDKNTGLVWEQTPDGTPRTLENATGFCASKAVGGTVGWRLPSVIELKSVQDPSLPAPFVPASVFTGVQVANYWSATTHGAIPTSAWVLGFGDGDVAPAAKSNPFRVWCVRGGTQESVY